MPSSCAAAAIASMSRMSPRGLGIVSPKKAMVRSSASAAHAAANVDAAPDRQKLPVVYSVVNSSYGHYTMSG